MIGRLAISDRPGWFVKKIVVFTSGDSFPVGSFVALSPSIKFRGPTAKTPEPTGLEPVFIGFFHR